MIERFLSARGIYPGQTKTVQLNIFIAGVRLDFWLVSETVPCDACHLQPTTASSRSVPEYQGYFISLYFSAGFCVLCIRSWLHTSPQRSLHNHGIIESLRLEKTSKIIKSNHPPNTTMPAKPCPKVPHLHVL